MAVLIETPRWPNHGTLWCHLVSDLSLEELHAFATANGVPERAFDLDHYDIPAKRHDDLIAAGAVAVTGRELVERLRVSGLRVTAAERKGITRQRAQASSRGGITPPVSPDVVTRRRDRP